MVRLTFLEKTLISFGDKWAKEEWDMAKERRRKKRLLRWFIKKVFYGYSDNPSYDNRCLYN